MEDQLREMKVGDKVEFGSGYWGDGKREKFQVISEFARAQDPAWQFQINSSSVGSKFSYELERIK